MLEINYRSLNNDLYVDIVLKNKKKDARYACYLYSADGKVIQKIGYSENSSFLFSQLERGKYFLKGFIRTKDRTNDTYITEKTTTEVFQLWSKEDWKDYNDFINAEHLIPTKKLPFAQYLHPYQDIFISAVSQENTELATTVLSSLVKETGLLASELSSNINSTKFITVLSGRPLCKDEDHFVAFSGMGRTDDRMIHGMKDIQDAGMGNQISGQVGTFCLLRGEKDKIYFESDFFGTDKIYYYKNESIFLASNRVHIILLAMREYGIVRVPNFEKIYANLAISTQFFLQNFSPELSVKGVFMLPADSRICIDLGDNRISLEKTELYDLLAIPMKYDEETYQILLHQAANEMMDNAKVALSHPDFNQFILHVTGGMDSRTVFCVLTNLPEYRDKIVAQTKNDDNHIPDYEIAMRILAKYPFTFNVIKRKHEEYTHPDHFSKYLSYTLGVTAGGMEGTNRFPYESTLIFPGCYGEIVGRVYFSSKWFDKIPDSTMLSDDDFFNIMLHRRIALSALFDVDNAIVNQFSSACVKLPGKTNFEKYENHYLFYRNGLHFNISNISQAAAPMWGIVQSKSLFKLKYMSFYRDYGIKPQMDLMYLLNPEIAEIEYANADVEKRRNELNVKYSGKYPVAKEHDQKAIDQMKRVFDLNQQAQNTYNQNIKKHCMCKTIETNEPNDIYDILHFLILHVGLKEEAAIAIYQKIKNGRAANKDSALFRKLQSLYYELTL